MTMYTPTNFEKKRGKHERMTFNKVPLPSTDVCTEVNTRDMSLKDLETLADNNIQNPLLFGYNKNSQYHKEEGTYAFLRFNEFLSNTCLILNRRLTPGFAKQGRVQLVGIDWRLIDYYFCQFKCNKTQRTFQPIVDRKKQKVTYFYYEFNELPDLGCDDWWIRKHQPYEEFPQYSESFYTKLKFGICTTTNRMWVDYWQVTSTAQGLMTA